MGRPDHEHRNIPIVVEKTIEYLYKCNANTVQGIFRLSGSTQQITSLRKQFDAGTAPNLSTVDDPHVVAGLLKLFLREMAEPLFPFDMYTRLINAYKSEGNAIQNISAVMDDLPTTNKALLKSLLELTTYIEKNASVNQMTSSNLSIVFAPNIIRAPQETMQQAIMDSPVVNSIVRLLLDNPSECLRQ